MTTPFQPVTRGGNFHHNAVLSWHEDDASLGMGFASAGDALIEHWVEHGPDDSHFLPIVYVYRHGLELLLKSAIRQAAACLRSNGDPDPGVANPAVDKWLAQKAGHSLQDLAIRLDDYLLRLQLEQLPTDTHDVLRSLHTLDPKGDMFRYATTFDRQAKRYVSAPRPAATHVNVVAMGEHFSSAANLIGGGVMSVLGEYAEMLASYGP